MENFAFLVAIPSCLVRLGFTASKNRKLASFGVWLLGVPLLLMPIAAQFNSISSEREAVKLKAMLEKYRTYNGICQQFVGDPSAGRLRDVPCRIDHVEQFAITIPKWDINISPFGYAIIQLTAYTMLLPIAGVLLSRNVVNGRNRP